MTDTLSFTGERFHPNLSGEMWAEHWHRYHFVLPLVTGKSVLDVASGEGYGSALMATVASSVNGVDVSSAAVAHAAHAYADRKNLQFTEGSCAKLPFPGASFDVVVSFETIEHIVEQAAFLDEIKRVLKPSGSLIISSPNRIEYSDKRGYKNEFHVKELDRAELAELVDSRFKHARWFSQRNAFVSLIVPDAGSSQSASTSDGETLTLSKDQPDTIALPPDALYFLVVATSDDAAAERLTSRISVFADREEWAYNDYRNTYQANQHYAKREVELVARCAELEQQLAALKPGGTESPQAVSAPAKEKESWLTRLTKRLGS
ncbi:MAG: class I SAM-dependent methyltransferase [Betaproteobacteria bacterium]